MELKILFQESVTLANGTRAQVTYAIHNCEILKMELEWHGRLFREGKPAVAFPLRVQVWAHLKLEKGDSSEDEGLSPL